MSRRDAEAATFLAAPDREAYLREHSGLPGPRGNLELIDVASAAADRADLVRWAALGPESAPENTPGVFLACVGNRRPGPVGRRRRSIVPAGPASLEQRSPMASPGSGGDGAPGLGRCRSRRAGRRDGALGRRLRARGTGRHGRPVRAAPASRPAHDRADALDPRSPDRLRPGRQRTAAMRMFASCARPSAMAGASPLSRTSRSASRHWNGGSLSRMATCAGSSARTWPRPGSSGPPPTGSSTRGPRCRSVDGDPSASRQRGIRDIPDPRSGMPSGRDHAPWVASGHGRVHGTAATLHPCRP